MPSDREPRKWSHYMEELYSSRKPPPLRTVDIAQLEERARQVLEHPIGPSVSVLDTDMGAFTYIAGSAGTGSTHRGNLKAFERYRIVPRMLVDATVRTLQTTMFGVTYPSPLIIAPIGVQGIAHAEGELATARAACKLGIPFVMSTASTRSIESVAEANGEGTRWYQLYWPKTNDIALSLLKRAKDNGFTTLVVTLDTMLRGWRPGDIDTSYLPFGHGVGIQVATSDPAFMARYNLEPRVNERPRFPYVPSEMDAFISNGNEEVKLNRLLGKAWVAELSSGAFRAWEDVKFLKDNWDGVLVLKGILSVQDAEKAIEIGVDGIIVSNHGGRQIDGALPSLYALDRICQSDKVQAAQKTKRFTVLFDSGIRTGSDIIKAIALGAQGILLGRPYVYGLAVGGQAGVEQVIKQTLADLEITLALSGYKDLQDIQGRREEVIIKVDLYCVDIVGKHSWFSSPLFPEPALMQF